MDDRVFLVPVVVPPWPKTIDWYNKSGRVLENEKYKMIADGLGMYALEIKKVEMMDDGEWKCVATSFFGIKAFTSCYVTVKCTYRLTFLSRLSL